ncbi:hypothetical protein MPTK1_1g20590 [Marchantia polymorpha subsp. ruderalis]|uniref:MATH domain-containing protein n=2 Tax=Marchantia polymorpha TaxID=3197 RepID=A0AAF6ASC1_MARPO|nr:hypothetical protein MARPO_0001s0395 [Marchantia polymorpha]BBM99341.1 hypothetical protein Mp_1g20590 [Marchantia polymorpha subsp. ruderalis]|eukprot:PTQ50423.1 hypothetical protein MARPO_0001s0395 [Marchantia polymorpha]
MSWKVTGFTKVFIASLFLDFPAYSFSEVPGKEDTGRDYRGSRVFNGLEWNAKLDGCAQHILIFTLVREGAESVTVVLPIRLTDLGNAARLPSPACCLPVCLGQAPLHLLS